MQRTPPIPDWIRSYRHPAYTNIYGLVPEEDRLYGTESLYGDWDAPLLLLAKDFAPSSYVERRIAEGVDRPFSHDPCMQTNQNLVRLAAPLRCPLLYGSTLAGLLRKDNKKSGVLSEWREVLHSFAVPALRFALDHMPHVKAIACLGCEAWECATVALEADTRRIPTLKKLRRDTTESRTPIGIGGIQLFAHAHPAWVNTHRGWDNAREDWLQMARVLGVARQAAA